MANSFADIFGSSPVMPLEKHVNIAYQCTKNLLEFLESAVAGNWDKAATSKVAIDALEHKANDLEKEIRQHLPSNVFLPVPRQDLLVLLLEQSQIADRAKDISGLVLGRKMQIPDEIADELLEYVNRNVDAAKQARQTVWELDELFLCGFRGAEVTLVESLIGELDRIKTDIDARQSDLRSALFAVESGLDPVDTMFLYRVIELTGEIADMAERVGRRLELLLRH